MGRDPQESDQDEVIVSGSDTQSDDEENCSNDSASQQMTETTTAAAPPLDESSQQMSDNTKAAAPPLDSASQEIELPPLLSDPEASVPETELIERDFNAMEAELTHKTAENHTQVASFALIFKNEHAFFQHLIDLPFAFFLSFFLSFFFFFPKSLNRKNRRKMGLCRQLNFMAHHLLNRLSKMLSAQQHLH